MLRGAVRTLAVAGMAAWCLVQMALPALAHGGVADETDYSSVVSHVVPVDDDDKPMRDAEPIAVEGVSWNILGGDSYLQMTNTSDTDVIVLGYTNEPYLRLGPQGAFTNAKSPATYLNADRYADAAVPSSATGEGEPEWEQISATDSTAWHDHRIHWMAQSLPPQVTPGLTEPVTIRNWFVLFEVDGERMALLGRLSWVPPPAWFPWIAGSLMLVLVPVAPVLTGHRGRKAALRAVGGTLAVVVLLDVVHGIDDLTAVPATLRENLFAGARLFIPVLTAGWTAWRALRAGPGAGQILLIGAVILLLGVAIPHAAVLNAGTTASGLPVGFTRLVVALNFTMVVPAVVAAWVSGDLRSGSRATPDATSGTTPSPAAS